MQEINALMHDLFGCTIVLECLLEQSFGWLMQIDGIKCPILIKQYKGVRNY